LGAERWLAECEFVMKVTEGATIVETNNENRCGILLGHAEMPNRRNESGPITRLTAPSNLILEELRFPRCLIGKRQMRRRQALLALGQRPHARLDQAGREQRSLNRV